jgi:hypothetical protein
MVGTRGRKDIGMGVCDGCGKGGRSVPTPVVNRRDGRQRVMELCETCLSKRDRVWRRLWQETDEKEN